MRSFALASLVAMLGGCQVIFGIGDTALASDGASPAADGPVTIDAPLPDTRLIDAVGPIDAPVADSMGLPPDGRVIDAHVDAHVIDARIPDAFISDRAIPDVAIPDVSIPDVAIPDVAIPDVAIPDAVVSDARPPPDVCGCSSSAQCGSNNEPICNACVCSMCTSNPECANRAILLGDQHMVCDNGTCVECVLDEDCRGATPSCGAGGVCEAPTERACGSVNVAGGGYVAAPGSLAYDVTGSFTIEAWIHPTSYPGAVGFIAGHGNGLGIAISYALLLDDMGKPSFEITNGGQPYIAASGLSVPLDAWTHVAGTFDSVNKTVILWINGGEAASATAPIAAPGPHPTSPFSIGNTGTTSISAQFVGLIDEVRLSNGLTYDATFKPERYVAASTSRDLAHFHFDEASGGYAIDSSSLANDGVLTSGAAFDSRCQYYRCGSVVTYGGYVNAPGIAAQDPSGSFTLEAYVQPQDLSAAGAITDSSNINVVDRAAGLGGRWSYHLFIHTDGAIPGFEMSCDGQHWNTAMGGTALQLNQWTHLAGVFSVADERVYLYEDGVQVAQSGSLGNCAHAYASGLPLIVASNFHGFGSFRGYVDELRLSSVARYTSDFSATIFQMPALEFPDDEGSTLALYHYDEDSGSVAIDSSLEANNATLIQSNNVSFDTRCF